MALALGKITILVGAGIVGSVLAQEGRVSKVSDFFSGAFKVVFKHLKQNDSPSTSKPQDNSLLAQVNSLRQELQLLSSSRSVTIISAGRRSGATTFGMPVVVIGVVGYGYMWWKGWKLSDLMFATRRSLSEHCTTVAKQLEQVHTSISDAKRHLAARINRVDSSLDECRELTATTRDEVSQIHGDLKGFGVDVESVQRAVQTLETKIGRIEEKQDLTNQGVHHLCGFVKMLEQSRSPEYIQASSSRPVLELPQVTPSSRFASLPSPASSLEPSSPSACTRTPKVLSPLQSTVSDSGLKVLQGISDLAKDADPEIPNGTHNAEEPGSSSSSSSGRFGWKFAGINASLLTRTRSATQSK